MQKLHFDRVVIIGVGLIGGSLAMAIRQHVGYKQIVGFGRSKENLDLAVKNGVIDSVASDLTDACKDADLVVLAVPLGVMPGLFKQLSQVLKPTAIITDVGSAKSSVIHYAREALGNIFSRFVPAHPIAGAENSGVGAADPDLFVNHKVLLTPESDTDPQALADIKQLWHEIGANVVEMEARRHDDLLALTSHLPHMLAYTYMDSLMHSAFSGEFFSYAAGGFKDFTRIASSDAEMWRDICVENREAMLFAINYFQERLESLKSNIEQKDEKALYETFQKVKIARNKLYQ